MLPYRRHHLLSVLNLFKSGKAPLDVVLGSYFRAHKALGSKDRASIAETVYHYVRWKNVYDTLKLDVEASLPVVDNLPKHLHLATPQKLLDLLIAAYGEEGAASICRINQTRAPLTLRTNTVKISREELLCKLPGLPTLTSPYGITLTARINLPSLPEFKAGFFEVQDEASQLSASLIQPSPKSQILDYCAGAGGKSLAIAQHMNGSGQLYLHDIRTHALQEARRRLKRAGVQNVQFNLPGKTHSMDIVVVDVPCSGTGTYRRNPDVKWKFESIDLAALVQEQRQIFDAAFQYLRPGGTIVYITCSILPQENEEQLAYFQETYNLKLVQKFQSLPVENGMDGFFAVALN